MKAFNNIGKNLNTIENGHTPLKTYEIVWYRLKLYKTNWNRLGTFVRFC